MRIIGVWIFLSVTGSAVQQGLIKREEALAAVYPGATVEAERVFLTSDQTQRASNLAGEDVLSALVARYIARSGGQIIGRAYVDTHVVRTKRESLLISLDATGQVKRIDVTAFLEPREYQAPKHWLQQYDEENLREDLTLQRAIRPLAGATLTALATNQAVRRVLAIDKILEMDRQASR